MGEDDWRKSLGVKGPADLEWESCCDACLDTSISSKQSYKDRCTPNEWGFSTGVVVCNKYKKDGEEKSYCGEPVKFINTDNNPHAKSSTDGKVEFKPEGSCDMVATDVDKIVTIFKTSKLTSDSSYQDIYNFYNGLGEADQKFWVKPYEGMGNYLLSAPVIAAAEDPGTLGAETNSYEKASIFIPDLRDKDCNKCAHMLNHATLSGNLDARGGTAYIHRAETLAGSKILVSGGVSLWGMSIINAAEISGSTTGDVFLYKIINSGTITINNVKGAVIQDVVNTGKIVLTDVVGNGIDISNKKGGSIEFKGSCNVNMNFRKVEAGSTVKFSADMVGKLGIPEADMGNISPPDGVTKEKYTPPAEDPLVGGVDGNGGKDPRGGDASPSPSGGDASPSPSSSSEAADDSLGDSENSTRRETMCVLAAAMAVLAFFSHFAC